MGVITEDWDFHDRQAPLIVQELHPEPTEAAIAAKECDVHGRIGKPFNLVADGEGGEEPPLPYVMPLQQLSGPETYVDIRRNPGEPESVLAGCGRIYTAGGPPDRLKRWADGSWAPNW